jgi:hypothetical protein
VVPDVELVFKNHQGLPLPDPPSPPVPPTPVPPTPPRPVPYEKDVKITELAFKDRDGGKTFEMSETQLNNSLRGMMKPNNPVSLVFEGTFKTKVGKTGLFVEVYDTYADKVYYSGNWYSNKESFEAGENYSRTIQWLFPVYIPQAIYEVTITLRDWINPSAPEFGKMTFTMDVKDVQYQLN